MGCLGSIIWGRRITPSLADRLGLWDGVSRVRTQSPDESRFQMAILSAIGRMLEYVIDTGELAK